MLSCERKLGSLVVWRLGLPSPPPHHHRRFSLHVIVAKMCETSKKEEVWVTPWAEAIRRAVSWLVLLITMYKRPCAPLFAFLFSSDSAEGAPWLNLSTGWLTGSDLHILSCWRAAKKVEQTLDVSASLPSPFPCPPPPHSYNLSQECFNFRDRFSLSNQAGRPVVHMMRCDGCKTIKKRSGRWERTKEERALFIGQI